MPNRTLLIGNDGANTLQGGAGAELIYGFNPQGPQANASISATRIATGLTQPLFCCAPPGDPARLFVVEKGGVIKIIDLATGATLAQPFLDLSTEVNTAGEQGLLGLAFHPQFTANGLFYVYLSTPAGDTEVRRYQVSSSIANIADPATRQTVATFDYSSTTTNHRAGWLAFGPEGYLYAALGDGAADPASAQRLDTSLGKILRIDVNADAFPGDPNRNYSVPGDNPDLISGIPGDASASGIYAAGLRNPFRNSFDRGIGDFFIADVGAASFEEINRGQAGANYGWPATEGAFDQGAFPNFTQPIYSYPHGAGASVTGGYVYRGPGEGLHGQYFFADFVTGQIWTMRFPPAGGVVITERTSQIIPNVGQINNPASFGEDALGNLYVVDLDGDLFRLTPQTSSADLGDLLLGGGGDDMIFGGGGNDNLWGGSGSDSLDGGTGWDIARYDYSPAGVDARLYNVLLNTSEAAGDTYSGIEGLVGSALNDTLYGDGNVNVLYGQGGEDWLDGVGSGDYLFGGDGHDNIVSRDGGDILDGGSGWDNVRYDYATTGVGAFLYSASQNSGWAAGDTYSGIEGLVGSALNDTLYGDGNVNVLYGQGGEDWLDGVGGGDYLFGGDGHDNIVSRDGGDILDGGSGWDNVRYDYATGVTAYLDSVSQNSGWAAGDTYLGIEGLVGSGFGDDLRGDENVNALYGQSDHDFFVGFGGSDFLNGGPGFDMFHFVAPTDGGGTGDLIQDFASGVDRLGVSGSLFQLGSPGGTPLESWRFVSGTSANLATTQFGYDSASQQVWYDADGTSAGAKMILATLQAGATLTNTDFVVF